MKKGKNRLDLFAADVTLIEELNEDGLDRNAGGRGDYSKRLGNTGYFCTLTKECQRICRWF